MNQNERITTTEYTPFTPRYTESELRTLTTSEQWYKLAPNLLSPFSLCANQMLQEELMHLIRSIEQPPFFSRTPITNPDTKLKIEYPCGSLEYIGHTENKQVFKYTAGESCLVLAVCRGFNYTYPLIPEDPHLTPFYTKRELGRLRKVDFYSDLRTYLCLPYECDGEHFGVFLQEYGGDAALNALGIVTKNLARRRVEKELDKRDLRTVHPHAYEHERHYLLPQGRFALPAVIDIEVTGKQY